MTHAPSGSAANPYPRTVAEVLDDSMEVPPELDAAMRRFRASKAFRGTPAERTQKLRSLYAEVCAIYHIDSPELLVKPGALDCYIPSLHRVELNRDRLSVITALHELGHVLGKSEAQTCRWSLNLFRRYFPKSFAKLTPVGHMLVRR